VTAYHVAPARGWLNDPNGLVHCAGRWHVFFQHNPDAARHGNIAWGHVSSTDLATWQEHPLAFRPQPAGPDRGGCWSGVSVVDGERVTVTSRSRPSAERAGLLPNLPGRHRDNSA